ncbi:hypothetical protein [Amycolatopsis sp. H20-H5]|uniref:hypothetical protein n=1 Tax=Amycolatopsis sp. H20-H5 TaxID=3046309 RepID=UPI002DBE531A|nr:hypothetical protein [Amycolatopsis sp. H20-H5]MEC3979626.1 hypothetical protein [Amycolatopsis sp. H20-H5]
MNGRPTIAVALHDGWYGCRTGAGHANFGFLEALVDFLPDDVRLVVLPLWLHPSSQLTTYAQQRVDPVIAMNLTAPRRTNLRPGQTS